MYFSELTCFQGAVVCVFLNSHSGDGCVCVYKLIQFYSGYGCVYVSEFTCFIQQTVVWMFF